MLAIAIAASPLIIASLPLIWFSSSAGIDWAYSLFNKAHPLNFGGNPAEVLSHLLNWILMTGCTGALCTSLIAISLLKLGTDWQLRFAIVPAVVFGVSVISLLSWTVYLDSRHGEGAVIVSFVLFFGPCTALSAAVALRILSSHASLVGMSLHVAAAFGLGVAFQWIYEHSGTGGPNLFVFPLLSSQVAAWWFVGKRLTRKPNGWRCWKGC
jgi:hypothetical protein